jgi:hypothetical protein
MTLGVLVSAAVRITGSLPALPWPLAGRIVAVRITGSLPALPWPLAGGIVAVLVDLSDLLLRDALDLGGLPA